MLGADRSVCNIYGGNTGSKTVEKDLRREVKTLWVKGPAPTWQRCAQGLRRLRLDDVLPLFERRSMSDEEMTAYLSQCLISLNLPRQSIETLLHRFHPGAHTDHTTRTPSSAWPAPMARMGAQTVRRAHWPGFHIRPGFTLSKWIGRPCATRRVRRSNVSSWASTAS